ncbi:zinc finger CCCH domain-containing protein 41 [Mercurialis annua]|uniref:zinc finger CCCH domain-containing protein 41 n=1 Tax=Mercurialis annua TaxID=3986 RepID=UPI00215F3244|nr:zinc finger CCCH domain-containing protein 41 [Mercurialis annua]XP_050224491.1 zinc finger CCCH domain-containing protein 41 [Mercurialis annua]XP_050224492.1 zinc finger CCCH domain-containing protein 41 [Mercurialis annua]
MELKVSSLKPEDLSSSDCSSDPEETEVSDEDDDDRNHKHRKRETRSQSMERDTLEPAFTRAYRKRNKPFENGHSFRDNDSQGSGTLKNYNNAPLEKDFTKFDKRRLGMSSYSRMNMDVNQRIRSNQIFPGEPGPGRGRGRDSASWNPRDSRFSSVDIASQMVQQGSITPGLFAGRGLQNVSSSQNASWSTFGLIPGIPSGGLDALHSIGLPGTLRPTVNSSLNLGILRPRCRDFEERGFCLRGDMCPMEHGVNRIVVEDVQSLSQFNLPVSLPSAPLGRTHAGPGALLSASAPSTALMNSKGLHSRNGKSGMVDDGMGFNGAYSGSAAASGIDLYDPDQPLWNTSGPETSCGLLALQSSKMDDTESFPSVDTSEHHVRLRENADHECEMRSTGIPVGSQATSSSVWGRVGSGKNRLEVKDKTDLNVNTLDYLENETKEDQDVLANNQDASRQGKLLNAGPKIMESSAKMQSDNVRHTRKSSQKAMRTLFVSGIPQKSNKRDSLLSHFQKFGEIVDIYIPSNSERAFVQFSKREEAEAALKAPDAVMGNRFIKLWWANRDSVPDNGVGGSISVSAIPRGVAPASFLPQPFIANRGKDAVQSAAFKGSTAPTPDVSLPSNNHTNPGIANGPKVQPPLQKKFELEQLKEELRKKQEQLAQKRNDFRRQLEKIEKQATGVKGEVVAEPVAKRHRVGLATDVAKATTLRSSDSLPGVHSPDAEIRVDKKKIVENPLLCCPKTNALLQHQETTGSRQPHHPVGATGGHFPINRYKLDNRPTTFKIIAPLPSGLTNVDVLKEHFSSYGDLSTVELEEVEACDDNEGSEIPKGCSACVTFTTRRSAERAFSNGKCWQGNDLRFMWVTGSISANNSGRDNTPASKCPVETGVLPVEESPRMDSHEVTAAGNVEPETSERESGDDLVDLNEVPSPNSTFVPDESESPKCEASATSWCSKEDSQKSDMGPNGIPEEKEESPTNGVR